MTRRRFSFMFASSRGNIILPMVIALAIAFVTAFTVIAREIMSQAQRMQTQNTLYSLDVLRTNVKTALNKPESFLLTINNPLNRTTSPSALHARENGTDLFSCLNNPTYNCARTGAIAMTDPCRLIAVVAADSPGNTASAPPSGNTKFVVNSTDQSEGVTFDGQRCTGFSKTAGSGSDTCPFRFEFLWYPECPPTGNCYLPRIFVKGTLYFNPSTPFAQAGFVINTSRYDFETNLN